MNSEKKPHSKLAQAQPEVDVDLFINNLLNSCTESGSVRPIMMDVTEIQNICRRARSIFWDQSILLELDGPVKVCGDIHGQYSDLLRIFRLCGPPETVNYLFLGDYVDRGRMSLETICLLFSYKIKYPNRFFLLRGNHESQAINRIYGFYDECKRRYNVKVWKCFLDVFNCLPIAAIVENQIFCCHGGLSPTLLSDAVKTLVDLKKVIREIARPSEIPESGLMCDLLWSDPWYPEDMSEAAMNKKKGWAPNDRGISYMFAWDVVDDFLDKFNLDLIIRAHQVVEDGFEFYAGRSLVTIFSAPNYCGEFDNAGAVFCLTRKEKENGKTMDLEGSFQILTPTMVCSNLSRPILPSTVKTMYQPPAE